MIRVAVAEDETIVLDALVRVLQGQRDFQVIATAANAWDLALLGQDHELDVILSDRVMPGNVPDAIRRIRSRAAAPAVIVLSGLDETPIECLEAGARAYLLKSSSPGDLFNAIRDEARWRSRLLREAAERPLRSRGRLVV